MQPLRQSTARTVVIGPFVDNSDFKTPETGLSFSVSLSKDGGAFAAGPSATHMADGQYSVSLTTSNTDTLGVLRIYAKPTGALIVWMNCLVMPANTYDAIYGGTDKLDVNVEEWKGTALPAPHTAGYPIVTVKDGTGTGEIDTASGRVQLTEAQIDQVVDETWNEAIAGHLTAGTTGAALNTAASLTVAQIWDYLTTSISAAGSIGKLIKDNLNATVSSRASQTSVDTIDANVDLIFADVSSAGLGAGGAGLTALPWNSAWDAEVQSEVDDALIAKGLDHLVFTSVVGSDIADNSVFARLVSKSATADWDTYSQTTDSLEAQRDNIGTTGAALSTMPWNAAWDAEVQSEANDALVALGLDHLVSASVAGADVADNSIVARLVSKSAIADWDSFVHTTDSLEAIRDKLADIETDTQAIETDTQNIQSRLPATLLGGRMDSVVGAMTAAALADFFDTSSGTNYGAAVAGSVVKEIADNSSGGGGGGASAAEVWDYLLTSISTSGSIGKLIKDNLDAAISSRSTLTTSDIDARLAAIGLDHLVSVSVAGSDVADNSIFARLVSRSVTADWDDYDQVSDSLEAIRDRGDLAWTTATGFSTHSAADVWAVATRALTDKSGFDLSTAGIDAIWEYLTSSITVSGGIGKLIIDRLDAAVSSRSSHSAAGVWASGTRTLTASLDPTAAQNAAAVWDALRSNHTDAGSFGQGVASVQGNVTGSVGSVTGAVGSVTGSVGSIATGGIVAGSFAAGAIDAAAIATDAIGANELAASAVAEIQSGLSTLTAAQVNAEVDTAIADARLDELLAADSDIDGAAPPTVGSVFHELMSKTAGSFTFDQTTDSLEALRDRGDAAWITATSVAVSAGGITTASFAAGAINAAAIGTGAIDADSIAADAANEIADAVLSRNVSNVEGSAGEHTLCTVILATLEWAISGATWTIFRTDGSTTHATKAVTSDAVDPITSVS